MRRTAAFFSAPGLPGAFLLLLTGLFSLSSCERGKSLPAWEGETNASGLAEIPAEAPATRPPTPPPTSDEVAVGTLRFVSYNVQNWLTMERQREPRPKPEEEKEAVIRMIADARPDMLGICEIGTPADLAELQSRLKAAGVDLPHVHHAGGADQTRHLAFLSRLPFSATTRHDGLDYDLNGRLMSMGRGILDVTVAVPGGDIRFLGAHLKSKREVAEADQELMRRGEAHLLRRRTDDILSSAPGTRLVVYGDMNDYRGSSAVRILRGPRDGPLKLNMAFLRDSRGETWTHHWTYQDVYSRLDYVFVSDALKPFVEWDASKVLDAPDWAVASDHRPLLLVLN